MTLLLMVGLQRNLAWLLVISRRCVKCKIRDLGLKVSVIGNDYFCSKLFSAHTFAVDCWITMKLGMVV